MAYVAGDKILDDEYNTFVNSSSSPYGYNHFAGTGSAEYGLGQTHIATVSGGSTTITASQWNTLLTGLDNIADHTNPSVERLMRAGAIVHALTTCPEFVWPWTCTSNLHGVTRNPWNTAMTSGASSGGADAASASGTTTLATGSDSAGSIRMPAAMCGIAGYKAPYGRNPGSPEVAMDPFGTGPIPVYRLDDTGGAGGRVRGGGGS